jgi:hypothetical protein
VIHRTFRSLDQPPKLVGFTARQWATLIALTTTVLAVVFAAHVPVKAAITLCVFLIGLPAALMYVSESGGLQLGALLRDAVRWRSRAPVLPAASPAVMRLRTVRVLGPDDQQRASARRAEQHDLREALIEEPAQP